MSFSSKVIKFKQKKTEKKVDFPLSKMKSIFSFDKFNLTLFGYKELKNLLT